MWQSESYSCFLSIPTSARVKVNFRTGEKKKKSTRGAKSSFSSYCVVVVVCYSAGYSGTNILPGYPGYSFTDPERMDKLAKLVTKQ